MFAEGFKPLAAFLVGPLPPIGAGAGRWLADNLSQFFRHLDERKLNKHDNLNGITVNTVVNHKHNGGRFSLTATKPKAGLRPVQAGFRREGRTPPVVARHDLESPRGLTSKTTTTCSTRCVWPCPRNFNRAP